MGIREFSCRGGVRIHRLEGRRGREQLGRRGGGEGSRRMDGRI